MGNTLPAVCENAGMEGHSIFDHRILECLSCEIYHVLIMYIQNLNA